MGELTMRRFTERERLRAENDRYNGIYKHLLLHVARAILQPRAPLVPDESPSAPSGHMACAAARARPNHQRRMGILPPPVPHHITRRGYEKKIAEDAEYKEKVERQLLANKEAHRQARKARVVPDSHKDLLEFFLTTEGSEMEFEVARCRPKLTEEFFSFLKSEIGSLRFGVNQTVEVEDRIGEIEVLQKVLREGVEAYDTLTTDLVDARDRLQRILVAKDKRATLLEMAGENELDRPLLALLDENIASATQANQEQAAVFMNKIRSAVVKYITL